MVMGLYLYLYLSLGLDLCREVGLYHLLISELVLRLLFLRVRKHLVCHRDRRWHLCKLLSYQRSKKCYKHDKVTYDESKILLHIDGVDFTKLLEFFTDIRLRDISDSSHVNLQRHCVLYD